ncbi:hypothetical protein L1787_05230 [Acuticoccus sp. M5D2P5]|uniref:hypothetical protein n=1 Tax=Acuticoccus kalidii TaxID=2910977 RepID=UPI001F352830|nr:hypothetical protein [Acuticoccus kalidii]MCF3932817.1 hypothetical protein [Acuticoccus kalidii]
MRRLTIPSALSKTSRSAPGRHGPSGRPVRFGRGAGGGWRALALLLPIAFALAACNGTPVAPAVPFLGAYFPSWLLAAFAGIGAAIVARVIFVAIGLDDVLPMRLLVYVGIATAVGFLVSSLAFGR